MHLLQPINYCIIFAILEHCARPIIKLDELLFTYKQTANVRCVLSYYNNLSSRTTKNTRNFLVLLFLTIWQKLMIWRNNNCIHVVVEFLIIKCDFGSKVFNDTSQVFLKKGPKNLFCCHELVLILKLDFHDRKIFSKF